MKELLRVCIYICLMIISIMAYGEVPDEINATRLLGRPFYTGEIIPQPQEIKYKDSSISMLDWQKQKAKVCIVIGNMANNAEKTAADILSERINRLLSEENKVKVLMDGDDFSTYPVVIAIGAQETNTLVKELCGENKINLNSKYPGMEGYILRLVKNKNQEVILCGGSDGRGSYYAVQSLSQMLNIRGTELFWQEVEVVDFPYFDLRMAGSNGMVDQSMIDFLGTYKMNAVSVAYLGAWQDIENKNFEDVMDVVKKTGICEIGIFISPHRPHHSKDRITLRASRPEDIKALRKTVRYLAENGVCMIAINQDDWLGPQDERGYALYPEDEGHFKNIAESQIYLMNQVAEEVRASNSRCRLVYCPPYYSCLHCGLKKGSHMTDVNNSLPGNGESFLQKVGKGFSPEIEIFWTGPEVKSYNVKTEDIAYLSKLTKHPVFFWDNTITGNKPFIAKFPDNFKELVSGVYWNGILSNPFLQVNYISKADYTWNTKGYYAERSFRNAIGSYWGPGMYEIITYQKKLYDDFEENLQSPDAGIHSDTPLANERKVLLEEMKILQRKVGQILKRNFEESGSEYKKLIRAFEWSYSFNLERAHATAQAKTLRCPRIEVKESLDGTLKEKFWEKAAKTSNFLEYRSGKDVKNKTYTLIGYDNKKLYIGFSCNATTWVPKESLYKTHDSISLEHDIVEIFLDPGRKYKYFHFLMNRLGTVRDEERTGLGLGASWNAVYDIKTHLEKDRWTLEIAIPFASLNANTPGKNDIWGINFCRNYKDMNETSSWSWTSKQGFHAPSVFGYLVFD